MNNPPRRRRPRLKNGCGSSPAREAPRVQSKPQLLNWITCDGVHIDPGSGKHTILGIFSNIRARQFPVVHPLMLWFLTLTDCTPGQHTLKISIGLDPTNMLKVIERPFESHSPMQRINIINELRNCSFPQAGDYHIHVEVDDELILATNLILSE